MTNPTTGRKRSQKLRGSSPDDHKGLIYELRCHLAEVLFAWAMKLSPPEYVASWVEVAAKSYNRQGHFADEKLHAQ